MKLKEIENDPDYQPLMWLHTRWTGHLRFKGGHVHQQSNGKRSSCQGFSSFSSWRVMTALFQIRDWSIGLICGQQSNFNTRLCTDRWGQPLIKGQFTLGAMGMKLRQLPLFVSTTIQSEEKKVKERKKLCKIVKMKEKLHCFDWHLINLSSVLLPNSGYHTMLWLEATHSVLFHSVIILNDTCRKYTFWSEETKTKVISLQWTLKDSSLHSAFFAGISQMKMEMTSETFPCCTWYFLCNVRWLSMMRNYKTYFL